MTQVKAKFVCSSVASLEHSKTVNLIAVYADGGNENNSFAKATPSGFLQMNIDNDTPASEFFEAGKEYYLTFEAASVETSENASKPDYSDMDAE